MCGLFGHLKSFYINDSRSLFALNSLTHRGPDQWGEWQDEFVYMGHRRLSIIDLSNSAIEEMRMPDLEHFHKGGGEIKLLGLATENSEYKFVIDRIKNCGLILEEIFVLARTNRQLKELSERMRDKGIRHSIKNDYKENQLLRGVTLATVHAAKGLEAKMVFVIGCNGLNFPIKGSEHPVVEMVKLDNYDKEEEERRLFYVALSRAKEMLYLTYTGNIPSYFITHKMMKIIGNF